MRRGQHLLDLATCHRIGSFQISIKQKKVVPVLKDTDEWECIQEWALSLVKALETINHVE